MKLKKIKEPVNNNCLSFFVEIEKYLKRKYSSVKRLKSSYKKNFKKDIFFKYYDADRKFMNSLGMEEKINFLIDTDLFLSKNKSIKNGTEK